MTLRNQCVFEYGTIDSISVKAKHITVPKSNKLFLLQSLDPQMTRLFHRRGQRGTQIFSTLTRMPYTRLQTVSQPPLSQTTVHPPGLDHEDHVPRPTTTVLDLSRGRTAPIMEGKVESKLQALHKMELFDPLSICGVEYTVGEGQEKILFNLSVV